MRIEFQPRTEAAGGADPLVDSMVEKALQTFAGQPGQVGKATTLVLRWIEQNPSEFHPLIQRLLEAYINTRMETSK